MVKVINYSLITALPVSVATFADLHIRYPLLIILAVDRRSCC